MHSYLVQYLPFGLLHVVSGDSPHVNVVDAIVTVPLIQISEARGQELVNPDPCLDLEVFNSKISVRRYGCRSEIGERDVSTIT
jgi:hypothetical protein